MSTIMSAHTPVANGGFTLIELLMAMSVFSFMLLIIVTGFNNVVRMHDAALSANAAQDNARTGMDELVRAVRDSSGVISNTLDGSGNALLCIKNSSGPSQEFFVKSVGSPAVATLLRNDTCSSTYTAGVTQAITNSTVKVTRFNATSTTSSDQTKQAVTFTLQVASANGTTVTTGGVTQCKNTTADRQFCSVVTLTSGAEPR